MAPVDYSVRTPPGYWAVVAALSVLGVICAGTIVWMLARGYVSWTVLLLGGLITVLPVIYFKTSGEYRARGVVRLGVGFIEVPGERGDMLRFAVPGVAVVVTRVAVRYLVFGLPMADVSRGSVIELDDGKQRRRISTLTLLDADLAAPMLADIDAVLAGGAPRGPIAAEPRRPPPGPPDRLEQQLERELAALD